MSKIENAVAGKILLRADFGLQKYGVTLERTDLTKLDWLNHAQEEAMDLANYLEVLIQREQRSRVRKFLDYINNLLRNFYDKENNAKN